MNIGIIGASAGVGLISVTQALEKGYRVTALSINTETIPNHNLLTKINGSATSVSDVKKTIQNANVVLVTIGTKKKKGTTLFSEMARTVVAAMNELESKAPVLVISGFGVGESIKYTGFMMKLVIKLFLKDQYIDKELMEDVFSKSGLNWEMIQPGMLSNGSLTGNYKNIFELKKRMKVGKISRADVAHYLISEAEDRKNLKKHVVLTY